MPRKDQIGFWRRFRSLLNEERHQFFLRHRGQGHDSPLRPNRAAEGVAQRSSCVFRAGEGRGCNFRIARREQISDLLDAHLRRRVGNANAVVVELTQQSFCFETCHWFDSPFASSWGDFKRRVVACCLQKRLACIGNLVLLAGSSAIAEGAKGSGSSFGGWYATVRYFASSRLSVSISRERTDSAALSS